MTGFNLLKNFKDNPEVFFRSVKPRVLLPQKTLSAKKPAIPAWQHHRASRIWLRRPSASLLPSPLTTCPLGCKSTWGDGDFDLKTSLITMAQASPFCGKPNEDTSAHLQQFLEICTTYPSLSFDFLCGHKIYLLPCLYWQLR